MELIPFIFINLLSSLTLNVGVSAQEAPLINLIHSIVSDRFGENTGNIKNIKYEQQHKATVQDVIFRPSHNSNQQQHHNRQQSSVVVQKLSPTHVYQFKDQHGQQKIPFIQGEGLGLKQPIHTHHNGHQDHSQYGQQSIVVVQKESGGHSQPHVHQNDHQHNDQHGQQKIPVIQEEGLGHKQPTPTHHNGPQHHDQHGQQSSVVVQNGSGGHSQPHVHQNDHQYNDKHGQQKNYIGFFYFLTLKGPDFSSIYQEEVAQVKFERKKIDDGKLHFLKKYFK